MSVELESVKSRSMWQGIEGSLSLVQGIVLGIIVVFWLIWYLIRHKGELPSF